MSLTRRVARGFAPTRRIGGHGLVVAALAVAGLLVGSSARGASVSYAERHAPEKQPGVFMQALTDERPRRRVVTAATAPAVTCAAPFDDAESAAGVIDAEPAESDAFTVTAFESSVWLGAESQTPGPEGDRTAAPLDDSSAGVAIPIPPGVWTGLSGLGGLAVIYSLKNRRRRRHRR